MTLRAAAAIAVVVATTGLACKRKQSPPASGERWVQVETWARPTVPAADSALLERALERVTPHTRDLSERWDLLEREPEREPPAETFDGDVAAAIDDLVAWHAAGGGIVRVSCADERRPKWMTSTLALARAALLAAGPDPDDPRVAATLYLAHRMRAEGQSLIEIAVGMAIATDAVKWARSFELWPGRGFRELAPAADMELRALAVEAVCVVTLVRASANDDMWRSAPRDATTEIAYIRAYHEETVHGASKFLDDTDALRAYLALRDRKTKEQSESVLLPTVSASYRVVGKLREEREGYAKFVAGGR